MRGSICTTRRRQSLERRPRQPARCTYISFRSQMRLGVFLPNWVGDVVMATPALRAMRKLVGDGQLIGIMRPYVAEVLAGTSWLDQRIIYDKPKGGLGVASREVYESLRAAKIDRVVLLTNSLRTAWMERTRPRQPSRRRDIA